MALAADECAHFLARGVAIGVVVGTPWEAFTFLIPSMKAGRVTRSRMSLGSWQSMQATGCCASLARLRVGHLVIFSKARDRVASSRGA